jgi:hypothetical protein
MTAMTGEIQKQCSNFVVVAFKLTLYSVFSVKVQATVNCSTFRSQAAGNYADLLFHKGFVTIEHMDARVLFFNLGLLSVF